MKRRLQTPQVAQGIEEASQLVVSRAAR
jgi:hypothetical protein